ncbi:glycosyltransferase involved in cell wall biosynthesis [Dysgonomonas sp. PH5-45]|uniref:glycosyltransferase family 4 protein n=1 Tax=unclassified Dysgonomonas TaxID=2630389 RepID=UPI0024730488|nr:MULTISPECIES: glycosyltransferase family 4 protein [unclassified Dysgonomonas]MDH6354389.1 glycosyltransferase involved in cell wall biosynthesis [Dysgonomonas sp. PH5-45]MDH6387288.1 glycosyltransferase involved in cell wall biosynthesis [Dysgonomonas sp. PH5-37]
MPKLIRITTIPISLDKLLDRQMSFMKKYYEVVAVSSDNNYLNKVGEKEGVRTFCVEMTRKITPIKDLKALWKLYGFLKKEKPLFVHTHTPKAGTIGMIAAWLAKVPNRLHTVAGLPLLEAKGNKRKLLNLVEKITYVCSTRVYPNSMGLKEIIIKEQFCSEKKLKVIGNGSSNGINTSFFDPTLYNDEDRYKLKQELNIGNKDLVFIFVGRLVTDKGINELIEAFGIINIKFPNTKLLLVGPLESDLDPLKENTLKIIDECENVIAVGWQSDVRPYLAISDALVFPSYREGFPNVVMQAGAMGLPSIVTNINGCNEIIIEGENGNIIPVKDSDAIYRAMELYLTNKDFMFKLKKNVRNLIVSRYEQKVVWEALLEEYKSLEKKSQNV